MNNDVNNIRAKKFIDLVEEGGMDPKDAAKDVGSNLAQIYRTREQVEEQARKVIESYTMSPEASRALVRATRNKIMLDAIESSDPKMMDLALKAANAIGGDKDVAIDGKPGVNVGIVNQPTLPPALQALLGETQDMPIIDVEVEDTNDSQGS